MINDEIIKIECSCRFLRERGGGGWGGRGGRCRKVAYLLSIVVAFINLLDIWMNLCNNKKNPLIIMAKVHEILFFCTITEK